MLTYLDANGQTYLSLLPTSSQVAMSRIYVGLCTIVALNGKSSMHLLFPCPDATFDSRPTPASIKVAFTWETAGPVFTFGRDCRWHVCLLLLPLALLWLQWGQAGHAGYSLPWAAEKKIGSDEANVYSLLKTRMEKELPALRSSWRLPVEVFKEGPPHS